MLVQKKLKNLFDNYITGFPANNLSQSRFVTNIWANKILTEYDINGAKSKIEIFFEPITNEFEIKKWDGDFRSVHVMVSKRKEHNDDAEKLVKKLYESLAITNNVVSTSEPFPSAPAPEINPVEPKKETVK